MEKYIQHDGCKVAYEYMCGSQPLTIILLHGYGLDRTMWMPQEKWLQAKGFPVINVDVRGHGNSRPTADFTVKLAAQDVKAIIERENLSRYIVCGLSMGAFVAQEFAFSFGGAAGYMLAGVTPLCVPYSRWEKKLLAWSGSMMKYLYSWQTLKKAMAKGSTFTKPARAMVMQIFDKIDKAEFLISWKGFTTCLHEEAFSFDAPVLVVVGKRDTRGTIQKHLPDWQKHYRHCTVKILPDAGHVVNLDREEEFNRILLDFIEKCT
jgi:pimeloyl-ACP methyl ester carboxylesterase